MLDHLKMKNAPANPPPIIWERRQGNITIQALPYDLTPAVQITLWNETSSQSIKLNHPDTLTVVPQIIAAIELANQLREEEDARRRG